MLNERVDKIESLTKSNLVEANTFLHTIHDDFEEFLTKHKKEHTNLNMKIMKVTEDVGKAVQLILPI
jgi:hypothetical protein